MSMKITTPWQIRMPSSKSASPRRRNWWNRRHNNESVPHRSITMQETDLDHLGALHHIIEHRSKR